MRSSTATRAIDSTTTRAIAVAAAFGIYLIARALVASAYPWQRAFDDFWFLPETSRWLAAGRLGTDSTFTRVPFWHLMLGGHIALFGRYGVLVLQIWIVLGVSLIYALWLDSGWRRSVCWLPLLIFLLSPQILLYSRQAVNELFIGLLTVAVMLQGERRGRRAALGLGSLVGLAVCTKLAAGLLGIVALGYLLRERERIGPSLARAAIGFALVAVPLLVLAGLQRGSWLLDNTGAFNLSGMTLAEWRALPDAATRQAVGMARFWETFWNQPGTYLAGTGTRAIEWLLQPSSVDLGFFYKGYPLRAIAAADVAAFALLNLLAIIGSTRRDAFVWLYVLGWTFACAFPEFTPHSPKVILMFPALLLAARGVERLVGEEVALAIDADAHPSAELELDLLESRLRIASDDGVLLASLGRYFEPEAELAPRAAPPDLSIDLRRAAGKRVRPDELQLTTEPQGALPGLSRVAPDNAAPLARRLVQWAVERTSLHYVFHAGAVARDARALLLPGPSGSGKSTLSLALAQHGFGLLSDEVGAVEIGSGQLVGFPRALALRSDVLPVLGLPASIGTALEDEATRMVRASELGLRREKRAELSLILLPRYARGSETRLVRVEAPAAALALFESSCSQPRFKHTGFDFVLDLARRVPCRALHYSDLPSALAAVDAALREL